VRDMFQIRYWCG